MPRFLTSASRWNMEPFSKMENTEEGASMKQGRIFGPAMFEVPTDMQVERFSRQLTLPDLKSGEDMGSKYGSRRHH